MYCFLEIYTLKFDYSKKSVPGKYADIIVEWKPFQSDPEVFVLLIEISITSWL